MVVSYEVAAEAEGWRPRGRRSGAPLLALIPECLTASARLLCLPFACRPQCDCLTQCHGPHAGTVLPSPPC